MPSIAVVIFEWAMVGVRVALTRLPGMVQLLLSTLPLDGAYADRDNELWSFKVGA